MMLRELFVITVLCWPATLAGCVEEDKSLGLSEAKPGASCREIYDCNPTIRGTVGQYWIRNSKGAHQVTCNMKLRCGGIEGGWMQVADLDMDRDATCPGTWHTITTPRRLCVGVVVGCASAHFYTSGIEYEHICGQAKGFQKGNTEAFQIRTESIDINYVEGISITIGTPRKHVWTYASGLSDDYNYPLYNCPCAKIPGPAPPAFVGEHYYCESGDVGTPESDPFYLSDPLWDGNGCGNGNGCCAQIGMPWFYRKLPTPVRDDFEARLCKNEPHINEDTAVELFQIYVQ